MNQQNSIFGEQNFVPGWYALFTRNRHEKKVDERLKEKGINSFLPLNTVVRRWSDRKKEISEPLFNCYLFVNIPLRDRLKVLETDGAVNLVTFNGKPAQIPEEQISAIMQILKEQKNVEPADYFTPGKKVQVIRGPFKDLEGILVTSRNNHRLVITIEGINQAVSVEIEPGDVELLAN